MITVPVPEKDFYYREGRKIFRYSAAALNLFLRKNPHLTVKGLARSMEHSLPTNLHEILNGKRPLNEKDLQRLLKIREISNNPTEQARLVFAYMADQLGAETMTSLLCHAREYAGEAGQFLGNIQNDQEEQAA